MILKDNLIPVGQLLKPHGIHGELVFEFSSDVFDREEVPFFILEIEGIYVPFRVASYRLRSSSTALLKLKGVDTEEQARTFSGLTTYISNEYLAEMEDTEVEPHYFEGFLLIDIHHGEIGEISEVDETTDNALFVVPRGDEELLIPVSEAYIVAIDHNKREITLNLPDGLLDL